ncbi:hypothetical protein [Heliophilum fasciatum]|uniref:Putative amino acid dehydrogenase n=1 Tax=Heliophilum fasciatum TaxID=35700 RepID=A0A4R2SAY4_9FIRM|nr:hypothetical protein [Heliophilum fasciatum]MCW2277099.1 putative amino acid dehydrogenase [Heliophilum fasciatum]TCP68375.1 putative amino acid dehydrogenase [Heliophilum fasciatum]
MAAVVLVTHPWNEHELQSAFPWSRFVHPGLLTRVLPFFAPFEMAHVHVGMNGDHWLQGRVITCPSTLLPWQSPSIQTMAAQIHQACLWAVQQGVRVIGLGGMLRHLCQHWSGLPGAEWSMAQRYSVPVVTGSAYTVSTTLATLRKWLRFYGKRPSSCSVVLVAGAAGSFAVGALDAILIRMLAREMRELTLVMPGQQRHRGLERLGYRILLESGVAVSCSGQVEAAVRKADVIVLAGASDGWEQPGMNGWAGGEGRFGHDDWLGGVAPDAIICHFADHAPISRYIHARRPELLLIHGQRVSMPASMTYQGRSFAQPGWVDAALIEAILLAKEHRHECFSLGGELSMEQVSAMQVLAQKHDFQAEAGKLGGRMDVA